MEQVTSRLKSVKENLGNLKTKGGRYTKIKRHLKYLSYGIQAIPSEPAKDRVLCVEDNVAFISNSYFRAACVGNYGFKGLFNESFKPLPARSPATYKDLFKFSKHSVELDAVRTTAIVGALNERIRFMDDSLSLIFDFSYSKDLGIPNLFCHVNLVNGCKINPWALKWALKTIPKSIWDCIKIRYSREHKVVSGICKDHRFQIDVLD